MTTKAKETTSKADLTKKLAEVRAKLLEVRLNIKAGQEKNTNAHKALKKEQAQLLMKINQ